MAAGGALVRRGGSSARVGAANDGPLEAGKRGNSMSVRAAKSTATSHQRFCIADKQLAKCLLGMQMGNSKKCCHVCNSNTRNTSSLDSKELCC